MHPIRSSGPTRYLSRLPVLPGVLLSAGLIFTGCAPPPPASSTLPTPGMVARVNHYWGTALSGAIVPDAKSAAAQLGSDQAVSVSVRWVLLERAPIEVLDPLGTRARLVVATRGGTPVLAIARLTQNARFGADGQAISFVQQIGSGAWGKTSDLATLHGSLLPGTTTVFDVEPVPGATGPARVRIELSRPEAQIANSPATGPATAPTTVPATTAPADLQRRGLTLALVMESAPSATEVATHSRASETALIDLDPTGADQQVALVVPANYASPTPARALVAVITISRAKPDATRDLAFFGAQHDLARSAAAAAKRPTLPAMGSGEQPMLDSAINSLRSSPRQRPALVYLAHATAAPTCEDLTLVMDDASLAQLQKQVLQQIDAAGPGIDANQLRWLLEKSAYAFMASRAQANPLPPEMASVLALHAGELAQHPDTIDDALHSATDVASLDARLTAENYIYLEDSSPSARARAYDWLAARRRAPAGYAPLDAPKARRAALEKALAPAQPPAPAASLPPDQSPVPAAPTPVVTERVSP